MATFYQQRLAEFEKELFEDLLKANKFNISAVAKLLGLSRGTLAKKLAIYFGTRYTSKRM